MTTCDLSECSDALKNGKIIVYPTDTLYALGADIYNEAAVKKIFLLKNRPFSQPLPVAVSSVAEMEKLAYTTIVSKRLAQCFLPGALTLVLKKKASGIDVVTAGMDTIAIRIPANPIALELLSKVGPLTVTSANRHGDTPIPKIAMIRKQFQPSDIAVYLDCGRLMGKPSTIVDCTTKKPLILREGVITQKEIEDAIVDG
ncbi:MAG: L-threonylcarbamoyladenylate synthase [Euryarchaeota archaeon]|nr:L-threonylcarbamoyladenylate synthase [Euryarchaeota archaeon]